MSKYFFKEKGRRERHRRNRGGWANFQIRRRNIRERWHETKRRCRRSSRNRS